MKKLQTFGALGALVAISACETPSSSTMKYPDTRTDATVDTFFGTAVPDPYRWLEDDLSEETGAWVKAQNEVTFDYLAQIPYRQEMIDRLTELWNYTRYSAPVVHGAYSYFYKNDGLQNQSVLYRTPLTGGEPEVFLDPNTFSEDGTTSLAGISFTKDGSLAAYQISEGGSDWRKVIILDAETKTQLGDTLIDVKFSGLSWRGNDGFYYSSYEKPTDGSAISAKTSEHKLFFHALGTPQAADELIFGGSQTPRRYIGGGVSEDGRYLIISAATSTTGNELYIADLEAAEFQIRPIVSNFNNDHDIVHTEGETLYILTNLNAPNKRLVKTTLDGLATENWETVLEETEFPMSVGTAGGYLFVEYLKNATSSIEQRRLDGTLVREISLPGVGSAGGFSGRWEDTTLYYSFTNYINPSTTYLYDIESGESEVYRASEVAFNPEEFESYQVFYTSADGTEIPMIITHKKGLVRDGSNPTMLYGYGGFNISLTPYFSTSLLPWLERGGVYAVANLRGGGEKGEAWHAAGTQMNKQNVFNDFIAAGEYLIAEGITSSERLGIMGGSNGGLLVGAVMTQRPDLMAVALPAVGVLDMLRYHEFTAGAGWAYDYGTAQDSPEMFNYLLGYSPYHNLVEGSCYPATMVTTADHDDRVVPAHSFKFAARLQKAQSCSNPTLIRIETNAGHGAGKPTEMIIQEAIDKWAFALWNMGIK
jgi:prolyl oligopeptidase